MARDTATIRKGHVAHEGLGPASSACHQGPRATVGAEVGVVNHTRRREGATAPVTEVTTSRPARIAAGEQRASFRTVARAPRRVPRVPSVTGLHAAPPVPGRAKPPTPDGRGAPTPIFMDTHLAASGASVATRYAASVRPLDSAASIRGRPIAIRHQAPVVEPGAVLASVHQTGAGAPDGTRCAGCSTARPP